jgi:pre-rRNA-processing protein TSR1
MKKQAGIQKSLHMFLQDSFAGEIKLFAEKETDAMMRYVGNQTPKDVVWRERHSYVLGENAKYEVGADGNGSLVITGHVRGRNMNANSLVHIQNHGNFQIQKVL